jgi:hypothetical protein
MFLIDTLSMERAVRVSDGGRPRRISLSTASPPGRVNLTNTFSSPAGILSEAARLVTAALDAGQEEVQLSRFVAVHVLSSEVDRSALPQS